MDISKQQRTTGSMSANISYFNEKFVGESDFAIVKYPDRFHLRARMDMDADHWHYLSFWIPADIASDGSENVLSLKMNPAPNLKEARANYDRFSTGSGIQWGSKSGELKISYDWKTARMHGAFQFVGGGSTPEIQVNEGMFDLTGITDGVKQNNELPGSGSFKAVSQWGSFNANQVSIESGELPGEPPVGYWSVVGRMVKNEDPSLPLHIALFIKKNVVGDKHDLKDNKDVWVSYFRPNEGGAFLAVEGTLSFTSLPGTGHAKGTLIGSFQDGDTTVVVNGEFDITDDVTQSMIHGVPQSSARQG